MYCAFRKKKSQRETEVEEEDLVGQVEGEMNIVVNQSESNCNDVDNIITEEEGDRKAPGCTVEKERKVTNGHDEADV